MAVWLNAFNYNDYDYDGISNPIIGINGTDINTNDYSYCDILVILILQQRITKMLVKF